MATAAQQEASPRVALRVSPDVELEPRPALDPADRPAIRDGEYCCECGHVLRVSGLGRHRVYFELSDEQRDNPVMNRVCPECGRGLPGKNTR
jgi:hypothetical protein